MTGMQGHVHLRVRILQFAIGLDDRRPLTFHHQMLKTPRDHTGQCVQRSVKQTAHIGQRAPGILLLNHDQLQKTIVRPGLRRHPGAPERTRTAPLRPLMASADDAAFDGPRPLFPERWVPGSLPAGTR